MKNLRPPKVSPAGSRGARACARRLLTLLFACACCASVVRAQVRPPEMTRQPQSQQQSEGKKGAAPEGAEGERDDDAEVFGPHRVTDPATILRRARFVYVRADSVFISGREVEDSLRKRKEFQAWGMVITRNEAEADLVVEITRKPLTRRFTFTVIDPRTSEVVASGKTRSVLFGKKIANKVAEKFANRVKVYRPYPPA